MLVFSTGIASAQNTVSASGRIVDSETDEGLIGVVIELTSTATPDRPRYYTSEYGGNFRLPALRPGRYKAILSFIGYEDMEFMFDVRELPVNIGTKRIKPSAINIDKVAVKVASTRTTMLGDTLCYNADAFKVAADAEVEVLLRKMPGITIADGQIEAHGEVVKQIYVDGKEFFGGSLQQVLQSIPAQAVERIEVYNRLSEAAQITGVDDGEGGKAINIVTRQGMSHSQFGKFHAGVGYEPSAASNITSKYKYTVGGSVNIFRGDSRVTVMGLVNNLNKQNLTDEGMSVSDKQNRSNASRQFSVNSQQGVASAEMVAVNYSDRWGARKRVRFDGNLFYNHLNAKNSFTTDRWYERPAKIDTTHYYQYSNPNNHTLRFRGRLEWKLAKRQKLLVIPSASYTNNSSINSTSPTSYRHGESGYRWMPAGNFGGSYNYSLSTYAQYSYRFLRSGRTMMLVASIAHSNGDNDRDYYSNNGRTGKDSLAQATINYTYSSRSTLSRTTTFRVQPTWRDRIGRYSTINLTYRLQGQLRMREVMSYVTDSHYVRDETSITPRTSSSIDGMFLYHQATFGYRYSKNRNWFSLNAGYQNSRLSSCNRMADESKKLRTFHHPIYNATVQWAFNPSNTLRISCNTELKAPSPLSMLDIYNVSSSQYITCGNPNLKPYAEHSLFARYTNLSATRGTTFMLMAKAEHIQDYIGTEIEFSPTLEVEGKKYSPIQVTRPVNLNGYWSYEGRTSIGFPIGFLSSNLNITFMGNYSMVPVMVKMNGEGIVANEGEEPAFCKNIMRDLTLSSQVTLGSNISENVDFTIDWRGAYSTDKSSLAVMNNNYFTHCASANLKVVLPYGITITTDAVFTQYIGFTNHYNDCFTLWNAAIGKKVLQNKGEVQLCAYDILGQNTSFARYVWTGYSQVRYNSTLGRYFLVRFTYNLRNFTGSAKRMQISRTQSAPAAFFEQLERKLSALNF